MGGGGGRKSEREKNGRCPLLLKAGAEILDIRNPFFPSKMVLLILALHGVSLTGLALVL